MREQKLLEEKIEKQKEKELKEQQRKIEREEKGMHARNQEFYNKSKTISSLNIFQRNKKSVKKRNENCRRRKNVRKKVIIRDVEFEPSNK